MDVDQNDDFYIILRGRPPNKFNVSWKKDPIILDEMRKWRVALTDFSYYHLTETDDAYFKLTVEQRCWTTSSIKIGALTLDLKNNLINFVDESRIESYDLEHGGQVTMKKPDTFRLGSDSQIIFCSSVKHELTFEDGKNIVSIRSSDGKFESESGIKLTPDQIAANSTYSIKNIELKICEGPYYIAKSINLKKSDYSMFGSIDDMLKQWQSMFEEAHVKLDKSKKKSGEEVIAMYCPTWKRVKGAYEDRREVCKIKFCDEDSFNIFGHYLGNYEKSFPTPHHFLSADEPPPLLLQKPPYLNIITSVSAPLRVNEEKTHILRAIHIDDEKKGSRTMTVAHPMFVPVQNHIIDEVGVEVKLPNGKLAPLDYTTECAITLHFKSF